MGLEVATYIGGLVTSNPPTSDPETQGANHLQLIKSVLQNTLGSPLRYVGTPVVAVKSANYTIVAADGQTTFLGNTSGGAFTFTLPTLGAPDAGWECYFFKTSTDVNPMFIAPPSGTIQSGEYTGLAKARRAVPGKRSRCFWTGSAFIIERVHPMPVGSIIENWQAAVPAGYEEANGGALTSPSTNYPEWFSALGAAAKPDKRGRCGYGRDDGGAGRITVAGLNFDNTVVGNAGGAQNHTLTAAELAIHAHGVIGSTGGTSNDHSHSYTGPQTNAFTAGTGTTNRSDVWAGTLGTSTLGQSADHTHNMNFTSQNAGSGSAHTVLSPGITMLQLVVLE